MEHIRELILRLRNPSNIRYALAASSPYPLRRAFDLDETIQKIIEQGELAGNEIIELLKTDTSTSLNDITLACYFYILEKIDYKKEINQLVNILDNLKEDETKAFGQHFATHTIKKLTNQTDLDSNYYYDKTKILNTITFVKLKNEYKDSD